MRREQRDLASIGLQPDGGTAFRLIGGFAIGCAVYALTLALISVSAGPIRLTLDAASGGSTILLVTASFLALSCMEELGFRAYPLRTLAPSIGVWPAQLLVSVDEARVPHVSAAAPFIGVGVLLAAALLIAMWPAKRP